MNISAPMYPIIPLLRYRYIISVIRRQRREGLGFLVGERAREPRFHPLFFSNGWRKKKTDTYERVTKGRQGRGFLTLARSLAGLSISGLGGNFSSLWRIITESFPPTSGFRHKRPSPFATTHPRHGYQKTGDTWIPFHGTSKMR